MSGDARTFRMRLPATSANLGSGFDAAAIALNFFLEIEAEPAEEFSIDATGHDSDLCSRLENNLILDIYSRVLNRERKNRQIRSPSGCKMTSLWEWDVAHRLQDDWLPLLWPYTSANSTGLQSAFWKRHALWKGIQTTQLPAGLVDSWPPRMREGAVHVARVNPPSSWRAIVVLPSESLATSKARAVLPATYTSADVVANIQAVSMLGLAFAQGRGDLLRVAMQDRIHQPYRAEMCPLLPSLLPLAGTSGILGVSLSGAGPAVLVIVGRGGRNCRRLRGDPRCDGEICAHRGLLTCCFEENGARNHSDLRS